ncbi:MAG TPA: N-6 DNA methylase [Planctomycetota bacterium]|nr:N-6 DNA methylase [Planctomycetota bacterium]
MLGRVYTPSALAARLVRRALDPLPGAPRVCDPACGEGAFLIEARQALVARGMGVAEAERCLFGVDVDPDAVARTRRALPGAEIVVGDALAMDWGATRFDAVVGNPPWASFSGRQAEDLPDALRRTLSRYESFRGWPSLHGPFLELAVKLARGRVAFLLPSQVLDLDGYGATRAIVRAHCRVEGILDCGERGFEGVTQPCCALFLVRKEGGSGGGASPFLVTPEALVRFADFRRPPADSFFDLGVHTGNCAEKVLRTRGYPIREGRDVQPYRVLPARKHFDPAARVGPGDYFRAASLARYREVPILLRQTASRPIAALHQDAGYFRNSVLACMGVPGLPHEVTVAWLNASAVAHYHVVRVREASQVSFPQVKLKHLRDLPLPRAEDAPVGLFRLAREVAREGRACMEPELDALVSAWFGLDAATHRKLRAAALAPPARAVAGA